MNHNINNIYFCFLLLLAFGFLCNAYSQQRRIRDIGVAVGILQPGKLNAITDVEAVLVGHHSVVEGDDIRTGVTVVLPHSG
ncbi:MAG: P1 family peptidase, partial [bacterium]|nr:P1 family peptidase [bacterium]